MIELDFFVTIDWIFYIKISLDSFSYEESHSVNIAEHIPCTGGRTRCMEMARSATIRSCLSQYSNFLLQDNLLDFRYSGVIQQV